MLPGSDAAKIVSGIVGGIHRNGIITVMVNAQHARTLAAAGWTKEKIVFLRCSWFRLPRHFADSIQFLGHFVIDFVGGDQFGENMVIRLAQQVWQSKLLEEILKKRIEKIIGGFDLRRPRAGLV